MTRLLLFFACAGLLLADPTELEHAWQLAASGHIDQAIQVAHEYIRKNPFDADGRLLLGSLLVETKQQEDAILQLTKAVQLRPHSAEAENTLGEAYNTFGNATAARKEFEKATALDPGFAVAQLNLGELLLKIGQLDEAAEHLDRAIQRLPSGDDAANAHYLRARVYSARNDADNGAQQLQAALSLRPDFPEAWSDLGQLRKTLLDDEGARVAFERAVQLAPGDPIAQYRLGAEYLSEGQPRLAIDHLEQAYRLQPEDQSTLNALQAALRRGGKPDEAAQIKEKLRTLLQKRDQANQAKVAATDLNNEGARLQKGGDLQGALVKYRAAVELWPDNVSMHVNCAVALLRLGQWTDGLNELHRALIMDPANVKIQEALAEALKQAPPAFVPHWDFPK